jgi:uncharacterized protein (TIGR03437 family)
MQELFSKMRIARMLMLLAAAGAVQAQTSAPWDTSGNGMLNGTYYFRQVIYVIGDEDGDISRAVTIYGNISFDGNGNYSITSTSNAAILDYSYEYEETVAAGSFTASGTYSIAASGYGFIASPYVTGDYVYGLVSANGVFVGSTTDTVNGYNDMLIAAPLASPVPTISSFSGAWTAADFDFSAGEPSYALGLAFNLNPDGAGNLNAGPITGYAGGSAQVYTQTSTGLKYTFSNGAAVATFPTNGELVSGQKYFYFSKDGNFMFGGSPITSETPFDFIVAVKTTASPTLSGLYYQAGFNNYDGDLDSLFGSFNVIKGSAPQTYLGHQRINDFAGSSVYDYTFADTLSLSGNVYSSSTTRFIVGAGGTELITAGIGPYLGISVALQAPTVTPTSTVFIDPTRIQNSASNAPFTAGIAPGELLTFYGQNLADSTPPAVQGGTPFPTTLGNVQVTIGGYSAPIYYVSPTQVSAIVPYEVTVGDIVDIQLTNDLGSSNIVTNYVANTAPGVFTQTENSLGYGAIEHLGIGNSVSAPYSLVSDGNPAVEGETLAAYLTGLGAVSPSIVDGALAPSNSATTNTITLDFDESVTGTNDFSGLAPGLAGLYQLNFTVPATGITVGPNLFDIGGPDSYMSYQLIPIQATPTAAVTADAKTASAIPPRFRRPPNGKPTYRNKQAKKPFAQAIAGTQK